MWHRVPGSRPGSLGPGHTCGVPSHVSRARKILSWFFCLCHYFRSKKGWQGFSKLGTVPLSKKKKSQHVSTSPPFTILHAPPPSPSPCPRPRRRAFRLHNSHRSHRSCISPCPQISQLMTLGSPRAASTTVARRLEDGELGPSTTCAAPRQSNPCSAPLPRRIGWSLIGVSRFFVRLTALFFLQNVRSLPHLP